MPAWPYSTDPLESLADEVSADAVMVEPNVIGLAPTVRASLAPVARAHGTAFAELARTDAVLTSQAVRAECVWPGAHGECVIDTRGERKA